MKMIKTCFSLTVLGVFISSFALSSSSPTDKIIKNFTLKSTDNQKISLSNYKNAKGFIVVFTCNKCPMAKLYSERLNNLNLKYKSKGIYLMAINAMDTVAYKEENFALMQKKVKKEKLNFPYLQDKSQKVAKQFGASCTPQSFLIMKDYFGKWIVKYEGSIDDSALEPTKANNYLEKALDELLLKKEVSNPYTRAVGCRIFYRGEVTKMD
ncbi:thioredoxin family protein [Flavobacterium sp.]|uniref:thioredoxin family protein n=1 Tax=Flavobacterium sp. TaxID=239 RepID=UPI00375265B2